MTSDPAPPRGPRPAPHRRRVIPVSTIQLVLLLFAALGYHAYGRVRVAADQRAHRLVVEEHRGPDPDDGLSLGPVRMGGSTTVYLRREWIVMAGTALTVVAVFTESDGVVRTAAGAAEPPRLTTFDATLGAAAGVGTERAARRAALVSGLGAAALAVLAFVAT